jgi:hypothetical protein
MTTEPTDPAPAEVDDQPDEPRLRVRVPGLKEEMGLGDAVARATSRVGIKPCAPCKRRQAALNRWIGFGT